MRQPENRETLYDFLKPPTGSHLILTFPAIARSPFPFSLIHVAPELAGAHNSLTASVPTRVKITILKAQVPNNCQANNGEYLLKHFFHILPGLRDLFFVGIIASSHFIAQRPQFAFFGC